jgi:arylsulfatase A-like enzyme/Flp pilus assembly protein TadD
VRTIAVAGLLTALVVAGGWWWMRVGRAASSGHGTPLGRVAAGVDPRALNVLLITLDTTRADRLGAYGFTGVETPNLDRIAANGVLFTEAMSSAPLTQPAHASIFTGRVPPEHGVRDNGGFILDPAQVTLAEVLRQHGYKTGGFVGAYVLDSRWGLDQGFETYADDFDLSAYKSISLGGIERRGGDVADSALKWIDSAAPGKFFAWVHFYDAHAPYDPPEPYKSRYGARRYAGEIAYVDSQVGRLLAALAERRVLDRTLVVVMGDHGESLGEHGEQAHGFFLYQSVLRVPLLIDAPYSAIPHGRRVTSVARSIDIMPTVLDLLGLQTPDSVEGQTLVPLMTGASPDLGLEAYAESLYPLHHFGWSDLRVLRAGRYKFIAAPRPELYDLQTDPDEAHNLYDQRRSLGDQMAGRLRALERGFTNETRAAEPVDLDPEARSRLAALGYVGSFVNTPAPTDASRASLPDPKDKIDVFNRINEASDLSRHDGGSDRAIAILTDVVRTDPEVVSAWFMLGNEYVRAGQFERALEQFRRALALKPDDDLSVINMANTYRRMGRDADARAGYERLLQIDPHNPQARIQLAEMDADAGRYDAAEAHVREALKIDPNLAGARNILGVIKYRRGDKAGGRAEVAAALQQKADLRRAHYNLALMDEDEGNLAGAIAEYRREAELHPDSYRAYFNLGRLYGQVGDRPRQLEAYQHAIEQNPYFAEGHLFLAKLYLDMDEHLDEAIALARKGLELAPRSQYAPLAHYIAADIYNRTGRPEEAAREAARGRALEASIKSRG